MIISRPPVLSWAKLWLGYLAGRLPLSTTALQTPKCQFRTCDYKARGCSSGQ